MADGFLGQIGKIAQALTGDESLAEINRRQQTQQLTGNILAGQFGTPGFVEGQPGAQLGGVIPQQASAQLGGMAQQQAPSQRDQLAELARVNAPAALQLSQALGIPLNQPDTGQRFEAMSGVINQVNALAQGGNRQAAIQLATQFKQERNSQGIQTPVVDNFLSGVQQDPSGEFAALSQLNDRLNPGEAPEQFTLKPGEARFAGGRQIAAVPAEGVAQKVPQALLKGLSPDTRARAKEAFTLAGGGKDGIKAFNEAVKIAKTATQREDVPQILDSSFPNASPAERAQLDAALGASKTVESGLKTAAGIRTEQRRLKKAKGFQERAVQLLDGIIGSDQLGDVIGSVEGAIDFKLFSDAESELIADIDEAQNILTAENMDLMTGVLSESDIKLLKNLSSGALNRRRSEARFIKDVTALRDKLSSKLVQTVDGAGQVGQTGQVGRFQVRVK